MAAVRGRPCRAKLEKGSGEPEVLEVVCVPRDYDVFTGGDGDRGSGGGEGGGGGGRAAGGSVLASAVAAAAAEVI